MNGVIRDNRLRRERALPWLLLYGAESILSTSDMLEIE